MCSVVGTCSKFSSRNKHKKHSDKKHPLLAAEAPDVHADVSEDPLLEAGNDSVQFNEPQFRSSFNRYQQKKAVVQGMMDLALMSSNAKDLRNTLEFDGPRDPFFYVSLACISISLILQILVAYGLMTLIYKKHQNADGELVCDDGSCDRIDNFVNIGILLITVVNVFQGAFGVAPAA